MLFIVHETQWNFFPKAFDFREVVVELIAQYASRIPADPTFCIVLFRNSLSPIKFCLVLLIENTENSKILPEDGDTDSSELLSTAERGDTSLGSSNLQEKVECKQSWFVTSMLLNYYMFSTLTTVFELNHEEVYHSYWPSISRLFYLPKWAPLSRGWQTGLTLLPLL